MAMFSLILGLLFGLLVAVIVAVACMILLSAIRSSGGEAASAGNCDEADY